MDGEVEGASWETGVWGNGLDFDGSNDYVKVDYGSAFDDITTAISISAWINLDDNETTQTIVSNYNSQSDTDDGFRFFISHQGYPEFEFGTGSSSGICNAAVALSENKWYHLVVTYGEDSSDPITFYINGEQASNLSLIHI